ncbi:unnamed protein product, partial [Ectocarpus sp. 12 AP-2014]
MYVCMSPSLFVIKQTWNARGAILTGASTPRPASSSRRTASPSTLGWPARTTLASAAVTANVPHHTGHGPVNRQVHPALARG